MSYLDLDLKSGQRQPRRIFRRQNKTAHRSSGLIRGISALATLIGSIYLILSLLPDSIAKVEDSNLKQQRLHYPVLIPEQTIQISPDAIEPNNEPATIRTQQWRHIKIKTGDTLASIFQEAGLGPGTTYEVTQHNEQTKNLSKIRPGQTISILTDAAKDLSILKYKPSLTETLVVKRTDDGSLSSELLHHPLESFPVYKSGEITSSLFLDAEKSNIPENLIMEMAGIFGWDIDFSLDLRKGDQFSVVYNELFKEGEKIRDGHILAAEFINQGTSYKAVYYTDPKGDSGYYTPDGKSMRKAFLRSPVKFSHISSRFSGNRWHPVLSKWRSHKGVDYAAARGTPIHASGDGKISFVGTKGGYGKTIFIQHGGKYTTVYAHLSRYAQNMKEGRRIKQGQLIGYVGSTGLASGPHLHYEFRVDGSHRNPLTVKLPAAEPIDKAYHEHFNKQTRVFLTMLEIMGSHSVANLSDDPAI